MEAYTKAEHDKALDRLTADVEASKGAHTPGPWTLDERYTNQPVQEVYGGGPNGSIVAAAYSGGVGIRDTSEHRGPTAAATLANARLIAAAPDLAEACRMAEHAMTGPRGEVYNRNTIDAITRALGKAGVL